MEAAALKDSQMTRVATRMTEKCHLTVTLGSACPRFICLLEALGTGSLRLDLTFLHFSDPLLQLLYPAQTFFPPDIRLFVEILAHLRPPALPHPSNPPTAPWSS